MHRLVVTVCDEAHEELRTRRRTARIHWSLPDPAEAGLDAVRAIRETVTAPRATRNHYHAPV